MLELSLDSPKFPDRLHRLNPRLLLSANLSESLRNSTKSSSRLTLLGVQSAKSLEKSMKSFKKFEKYKKRMRARERERESGTFLL